VHHKDILLNTNVTIPLCPYKVIQILIIKKYNISIHDEAPKYVGMLSSDIKNVYENIPFGEYDHYSH
jgi:hypothetical protein